MRTSLDFRLLMNLPAWALYGIVISAVWGHFALHLAAYNRINATGLPRGVIKAIGKLFMLTCVVIPLAIATAHSALVRGVIAGELTFSGLAALDATTRIYGLICAAAVPLLAIPWLLWRPILALEAAPGVRRRTTVHDLAAELAMSPTITRKSRIAAKIPLNQLLQVSIEQIDLPVRGLPAPLDGYRIAHLSDLHLTGDLSPAMTAWVVGQANRWSPDLMALTGDILDYANCIAQLAEALGHASAPDGCYFVLGNHDKRVSDPGEIRAAMIDLGWRDLGGKCIDVTLQPRAVGETAPAEAQGTAVQMIGNESPWFAAPCCETTGDASGFRLLLAHSPDQLSWARRRGVQLMLAGHTHGGQGRLPLAGPLLSPSWHGSRYASGDFYKPPTTLHVSRGLGGVHLLRINCRPELSLLTLRCSDR
jgi:uncharacterized protein